MATTGEGYGVAASAASGNTLIDLQTIFKYHGYYDEIVFLPGGTAENIPKIRNFKGNLKNSSQKA